MKYESCFLGVPLPEEFLKVYTDLQENIRQIDPSLTLQDINILEPHITIYYCGEQTEEVLEEISEIANDSKNILNGLTIKVGGLDFFVKDDYNVLFLDVIYPKELIVFQEEVNNRCAKFHRDNEILKFHPHLTVGGISTNRSTEELEQILLKLKVEFSKVNLEFPIIDLVMYGVDSADKTRTHKKLKTITFELI